MGGYVVHAFGLLSHHAWLFQTIRGCQWQSWVSQVDNMGLDAYLEEDAAVGGIIMLVIVLLSHHPLIPCVIRFI